MHWPRLNTDQFNEVVGDIGTVMDDDSTAVDYTNSALGNLPTELLVEIFSYLPICDKIKMQHVSPRFKHIMEVPSLWKDFLWPYYEPLQVCTVSKIIKAQGEHVRRIFFPAKLTSANILEISQCCTKVTHLSLPRNLSLDHLEEIVHTMKHLQQLDVFVNGTHKESRILATVAGVKELTLRYCWDWVSADLLKGLLAWIKQQGDSLPSVINVFAPEIGRFVEHLSSQLTHFWSTWSSKLPSFEVALYEIRGLYDIRRAPINLYPSIPLMKIQFGPSATPPLIKLSDHGILGLQYDTIHFTDYDHYGEVRHSITVRHKHLHVVKEQLFNCMSNLYSVSNVDFSFMDIYPGHLEQLAIACPNLERINIKNARSCLQSLKGLHAIVNKCKNLQGINLAGIPIPCVVHNHLVSHTHMNLLLWELLSSVKKLTHLGIDLSMLTHHGNCDDVDQQKLIGLLKSCGNLKALEVRDDCCAVDTKDLLFSHFPSLVYVRLETEFAGPLEYTITNCHQLKYLYYYKQEYSSVHHISLPSSSSCHLQQLHMENIDLSAASIDVLSAYGGLEQVILYDVRITTSAITTLISNSPNLILLHIISDDVTGYNLNMEDYKNTISEKFSNHKLFTVGDYFINFCSNQQSLIKEYHHHNINHSLW